MEAKTSMDLEHQDFPVTARLQVWHYSERGRCPQFNRELARLFSPQALGGLNSWMARPAKVVEPAGISIRDHYVPVEVDFVHRIATYNRPIGNPESGVRDIFKKFAPPIVYDYFISIIQSPPHAMCIHALANGEAIADKHIKMKYTHAFFFVPLELRLKRFIKPSVIYQEDVIRNILHAGVNSLPVLGALILAYMAYQGGRIPKGSDLLTNSKTILNGLSSQLPWLKSILDSLGPADEEGSLGTQELGKTHIGSESLALLDDASASSNRLRNLTNGFQTRLGRSPHSQGLTNQGILEAMGDLREARLHFSDYQNAMVNLNGGEIAKWFQKADGHQKAAIEAGLNTIGFAALASFNLFHKPFASFLATVVTELPSLSGIPPNDVAPTVGLVGAVASAHATYGQYTEMNKSLAILNDVQNAANDGKAAFNEFFKELLQTQAALALDYMEKAMRLPMECMGYHELNQAFKMLGADLKFLGTDEYRDTIVQERIEDLLKAGKLLHDAYQATMDAMNVVADTVGVAEEYRE
ncbi:hypothetical protein FPOAC2_10052 [Fusarium poae]